MRILLAEDDKSLSTALVAILKHNGYAADAVYNGRDAIDYLLTGVYDAAVLDIMMPYADGLEVLRTVRGRGCHIPVLLLTAKSDLADKVGGLDAGADDYLTKPFAVPELLARLRAMTRRPATMPEDAVHVGDVTLDRTSHTLRGPLGEASLTAKEYQLAELFFRYPTKIFSPDVLVDRVWGFESETEVGAVWTFVSFLRKKLSAVSGRVTVRSVRGAGYRTEVSDVKETEN